MLGIVKAYTTRVGAGPFPTELHDEVGQRLGERGREFGTVTGRPRRCGWFDAVLVRQAVKLNGINGIALTKLDVLDGLPTLKICTGYTLDGELLDHLPAGLGAQAARRAGLRGAGRLERDRPRGARSWAELPANAVKYVRRIEELVECPGGAALHQPGARRHHPDARPVPRISGGQMTAKGGIPLASVLRPPFLNVL